MMITDITTQSFINDAKEFGAKAESVLHPPMNPGGYDVTPFTSIL